MPDRVRVVIPVYKNEISQEERISLIYTKEKLERYGITFLAPEGLELAELFEVIPGAKVCRLQPEYFEGFSGYNRMMLSKELYQKFCDNEYILICQQDVLAVQNLIFVGDGVVRTKHYLFMAGERVVHGHPEFRPFA